MESYVVIGGGIAGLTAANALAGPGRKVVLMEQSDHLGGRAITQRDRGYLLNLGPHALYAGGAAARTLRQWNIPFSGQPPDTSSGAFLMRDSGMYPLIVSPLQLLGTRLFGVREKLQAARILQRFLAGHALDGESMEAWIARHAGSAFSHRRMSLEPGEKRSGAESPFRWCIEPPGPTNGRHAKPTNFRCFSLLRKVLVLVLVLALHA